MEKWHSQVPMTRLVSSGTLSNRWRLLRKILKGHTYDVYSVAITPDGKMAISGSMDKTCILWDLKSGMPYKTLKEHNSLVKAVAITPDGKMAVSGSLDNSCILWDLERGIPRKTLKGHIRDVKAVAITPDGKMALSGSYGQYLYPLGPKKRHTAQNLKRTS